MRGRKQKLIDDLRDHIKNAAPFSLTFAPCGNMTKKQRSILENELRTRFHRWADSWILPWIAEIEAKFCKSESNAKPHGV